MQFDSLQQFFSMGGYGAYVWFCFGFTFGCLGLLITLSKRQTQKFATEIQQAEQRQQRAQAAAEADLL